MGNILPIQILHQIKIEFQYELWHLFKLNEKIL